MEVLAARLFRIPGVVAVTLGGSRAVGAAAPNSDWDFGLYYDGTIDPADISALGWRGEVFRPGDWGPIVNGGAWLEVDGVRVDLIYRDLREVMYWTEEAQAGRFRIDREVGYVAGIATYVLAGELATNRVLAGELPRPAFPATLRATAPPRWTVLADGALRYAAGYAARDQPVGCLANLTQAVLATAQARLAGAGRWALNEKRIVSQAELGAAEAMLRRRADDLPALVRGVADLLRADVIG